MIKHYQPLKQVETEQLITQPQDNNLIKCYTQVISVNIYHFYISDEIQDYKQFQELIHVLKTAEAHDKIIIYLNCPGGDLYVTIQIINAIRTSRATVITCMDGKVYSAATLIFLAGHEFIVNKNCSFMIHSYSEGNFGKGNEIVSRINHVSDWFQKLTRDIYGGFLSETEIKDVLEGKDIWLDSDEVLRRLQNNSELKSKDEEKVQEKKSPVSEKKNPATKKLQNKKKT
jgi:ATP-dependent protease ClpP protease subunit